MACIAGIIQSTAAGFVGDILTIDAELEAAGAKNIVVWNVPDIGKTPAVLAQGPLASALGTTLASTMSDALAATIGGDLDAKLFDSFDLINDAVANPGAFGLSNVTDACAQFLNCDPSQFLFWDGIHRLRPRKTSSPTLCWCWCPSRQRWRCSSSLLPGSVSFAGPALRRGSLRLRRSNLAFEGSPPGCIAPTGSRNPCLAWDTGFCRYDKIYAGTGIARWLYMRLRIAARSSRRSSPGRAAGRCRPPCRA